MNIRELTEDLKTVVKSEFQEDEKRITEDVNHIIEWLDKQPHINAKMDPQLFIGFLRGCKYSLEKTKTKIDFFHTVRTHLPEVFLERDTQDVKIQKILDIGAYLPLPATEKPNKPRVVIVRPYLYNPKECTFEETLKVYCMYMDVQLLEDDRITIAGLDLVVDLAGQKLEQLGQLTPAVIKKSVTCFQEVYPFQIKSFHFINGSPLVDTVISLARSFMSKKMKDRMVFHSKIDDLFKAIPQCVFPSDYGGEAPSIADLTQQWKQKVLDHRDWFNEDSQYRVIESLRPGKQITTLDLFGVDGSFKKLNFD